MTPSVPPTPAAADEAASAEQSSDGQATRTTADDGSQACVAHRARIRAEYCDFDDDSDDDDDDLDCMADHFECGHDLDLDGDGTADRIQLAGSSDLPVFDIQFGDGREGTVGASPTALTEYLEPDDVGRKLEPGFDWVVGWRPAKRSGDKVQVRHRGFEAGAALGDAVWITGSDAAALLMLTAEGWLIVELGY